MLGLALVEGFMSRSAAMFLLLVTMTAAAGESALPAPLQQYGGRIVYVDFWASWCAPCAQSFPWLNKMHERYGDRLVIVGVNVDANADDAQRFLSRYPARFDIVRDPNGELAEHYRIEGMPSTVILDGQGRILHQHSGYRAGDAAQYEAWIQQALSGVAGPEGA